MESSIQKYQESLPMEWSVSDVMIQVQKIQEIMHQAMKKDEHYGIIPGTTKPTLYKPGAEKLGLTFRLMPQFKITKSELPNGHREYEVVCTLIHVPSQLMMGEGVGSCSTMESKYRFRKANQKCPKCGKEETIIKGKKEYGGGWLCYAKKGGCGAKFKDGDPEIENQNLGRIEHDNPADYYNTVLKMAKKRSHVDAMLTATAASDIFTQDLEDLRENNVAAPEPEPESAPEKWAEESDQSTKKRQSTKSKSKPDFEPIENEQKRPAWFYNYLNQTEPVKDKIIGLSDEKTYRKVLKDWRMEKRDDFDWTLPDADLHDKASNLYMALKAKLEELEGAK